MIKVFPDINSLNNFAAEKFVEIANNSIEQREIFTVVLAGGSTPKSLYQLLASDKFNNKIDWKKAFFFFGDERQVPPDDSQSNFRMAKDNLFESLEIDVTNIFRWQTELKDAEDIAANYEKNLREFFDDKIKPLAAADGSDRFDLILLGMGDDGHTASLFPFTEALRETDKIAAANYVKKLDSMRFTLTFPIINNARNVMFLVKGADKAETLRDVLEGEFQPDKLPSQNVKPTNGDLFWLCDAESAAKLKKIGA